MNVTIESAHYANEGNRCGDWLWLKMCGKHSQM